MPSKRDDDYVILDGRKCWMSVIDRKKKILKWQWSCVRCLLIMNADGCNFKCIMVIYCIPCFTVSLLQFPVILFQIIISHPYYTPSVTVVYLSVTDVV